MTYNVFGGTLNIAQLNSLKLGFAIPCVTAGFQMFSVLAVEREHTLLLCSEKAVDAFAVACKNRRIALL